MMSEKLFNNAYLHFFCKNKKTTFISLVVFLVVVFFIGHFMTGNSDTVWRRKAGAAHLQDLAAQYRANPTDHRPLREISEIAQSSFFFDRCYAMGVLADICKFDDSVVPLIGQGLRDINPYVRHSAGSALYQIGPKAKAAKADLIYCLKQFPNEGASSIATKALLNIGDSSNEVLEAIEESAKAKDSCYPDDKRKAYRELSGRDMP